MTQPRTSQPTISFIDKYCQQYQRIFPEVRSYEAFKQIQLGIITPSQRKSLAKLAEIVGLENSQSLIVFEIYKPKSRLKTEDTYQSKPQIAATLVKELVELGFKVKRVLADSLYGESSSNLIRPLEKLNLKFMVAIRRNHGVYLSENERVRQTKWRQFKRTFSDGHSEIRYVQEIIFGRRAKYTYWYVTTDKECR
jgi:SRSO17 transposase